MTTGLTSALHDLPCETDDHSFLIDSARDALFSRNTRKAMFALPEKKGRRMVQAYVLLQTEIGAARRVAERLASLSNITSVAGVTGPYDIIALISASDDAELSDILAHQIQPSPGITRTLTCSVLPGARDDT